MRWILLLLLLPSLAFALDVPSPEGFATDKAGMLTQQEEAQLEQLLSGIEQQTTAEIAVLILPSLEGDSLEAYATRAFREWGVGKADVDNGILLLIVGDSREVRIETGVGAEGAVTDVRAGLIIRNRIAPAFQRGAYYDGIAYAVTDMGGLLGEDPAMVSAYERTQRSGGEWVLVAALIVLYSLVIGFAAWKYKKDKAKKQKVMKIASGTVFVLAWVLSTFVTSAVLWFVLIFILMVNITATGTAGFFFFPGPPRGGLGGGGFGGFGGGFSGGGGSSGGW